MGKYRGYEKYKDSGVEWLGEIPEHWISISISRLTSKITDGYVGPTRDILVESGIRYLQSLHIKDGKILFDRGHYFVTPEWSDQHHKSKLLVGDILIVQTGDVGQTALVREEHKDCNCHALIIMTPIKEKVHGNFIELFLRSQIGQYFLKCYQTGALHPHLNGTQIKDIKIPLPSMDEQESIAHFLDRKTSQIDALIAKKEALLEKLDEKRTALISHAVTKGCDPNVSMKDSGVEWLGEIPEHWIVSKARFASSIFVPQRNKPELNSDEGLPWVTMDDMSSERIKETLFKVSDIAFKIAGSKMLKKNSVIASCIGNFGICAINDVDVIINQQLQAFIPFSTIIPEYLCEIVRISNDYFKMIATAATVVYVNQSGFANMPILLPPKEEQEEIVNFTVLKITKIDQQKAKVKEAIALLKEYRTALITNAVTGKIDVRQEASLS
jgi:type I restriction enzyme, S subunit